MHWVIAMTSGKKAILFGVLTGVLIASFSLMIYFGKETFLVTGKESATPTFRYHFVLIPEEMDNAYWRLVEQGARDAAKEHNIYLDYVGPKQADLTRHLRTIDMAIAGKVDGIITQGLDNQEFIELLDKAEEKHVPVVTIDSDNPESQRKAYIGTNNYYAGFLAGKALLADTRGEQRVGVVIGRRNASHQQARLQGFMDAVKSEERIHIVAVNESNITETGAVQATYDLLKEYPDLNAFYGTSALDGIGIAQVVYRVRPHSDPYIMAFDTLPETLELIEKGKIDATVVQYPYQMGYQGVEIMLKIIQGEHPDSIQHTDTEILRRNDLPSFSPVWKGGYR